MMTLTEAEWEYERIKLYHLIREHPDWSVRQLQQATGHSETWVKKWKRRWRDLSEVRAEHFQSQSRSPKTPVHVLDPAVRETILTMRDQLIHTYERVIGARTIRYHLHQDKVLQKLNLWIPLSSSTIWKILKDAGRIPVQVREHQALERPDPMQHWEFDFGQIRSDIEFLSVVDRGTSILVDTQAETHYNAETALLAIATLFVFNGLPQKLRFDRDPRLVGSWAQDEYPSPLKRFLLALGVVPDITPPRKPTEKPFVERSIRTLKYEALYPRSPKSAEQAAEYLGEYRYFYNHNRMNQSLACRDQPPYVAFPVLPTMPFVPEEVNPDAWVSAYDGFQFQRRVARNGSVSIDKESYYISQAYAGQKIVLRLNAFEQAFKVIHRGQLIRTCEIRGLYNRRLPFGDYLKIMAEEARTIARRQQLVNLRISA